jgi:hypothetical protein
MESLPACLITLKERGTFKNNIVMHLIMYLCKRIQGGVLSFPFFKIMVLMFLVDSISKKVKNFCATHTHVQ